MASSSRNLSTTTVEATVTSKGQITLPRELRRKMGIQTGSRVRFTVPSAGDVRMEMVRYNIHDLWRMADEGGPSKNVMSFEEMNAAKVRRRSE